VAIFGEKDYQQLMVIRRMARDLDLAVRIEGAATVREADGLAMSSRNAYLASDERQRAAALYRVLTETAAAVRGGAAVADALRTARDSLTAEGFAPIDYVELCDAETLASLRSLDRPARLLVAAYRGKTRLIDNIAVIPPD